MSEPEHGVLVDTNVFSMLFTRTASERDWTTTAWKEALAGRPLAISFQSRQEVLAGTLAAAWGEPRRAKVVAQLDRILTIWPDVEVTDACARLYADCRAVGHPLHQKLHMADRWIAACAVAFGLPLATDDQGFHDTPGLEILRREDTP